MAVEGESTEFDAERNKASGKTPERAPKELVEAVSHPPNEGIAVSDMFGLDEIFTRVLATADDELSATNGVLFWSGMAAGLTLGLTLIARAVFTTLTPDASPLLHHLFYPIGFVIVVMGRYQLFTENTLTPVALVLTRLASLGGLFRVWGLVYVANMVGAAAIALLLASSPVFSPEEASVALGFGQELSAGWSTLFWRAVIAGWLVATLVWLNHSVKESIARLFLVWVIMYLVGAAGLFHCITSSVEAFYLAFNGGANFWLLWPTFILPVTLGNIVGGVVFVAIVNYAQFGKDHGGFAGRGERLPWRHWLAGRGGSAGE